MQYVLPSGKIGPKALRIGIPKQIGRGCGFGIDSSGQAMASDLCRITRDEIPHALKQ